MKMLKFKTLHFSYSDGEETFLAVTSRSLHNDTMSLDISTDGDIFTVQLSAKKKIKINRIYAAFEYDFAETDRVFLNGYQSWTDSTEHGIHGKMRGLNHLPKKVIDKYEFDKYGDYNFADYENSGSLHGWSYGYIRCANNFDFIGSLAEDSGFTQIITNTKNCLIGLKKDCEQHLVSGEWTALKLLLKSGTESEVFEEYFRLLGVSLRPEAKPIFGYTSWYRHYQGISEDIIKADLDGLKSQKYKADVFQIDDGYQTAVGDWLSVDSTKFPNGMKSVADMIKESDLLPGIWLAPFVCEENSDTFRSHKDWLVTDEKGNYVRGGSNWSGFYSLDIYNDEVRSYLRNVFDTIVNDWGYRLLKLDFLYAACIQPCSDKTRGQIMADGMSFLREIAGDAFILGCGVPLASAFGKVDYCRIGCDVSLDWNDKPHMRLMHRERVSTKNSILNSVFRRQLNGRAFLSDPDVFLLRTDSNSMTAEQRQCLAEVNALTGSVLFTSDNIAEYGEEQFSVLSRSMKLRDADIISADASSEELRIRFALGDKKFIRKYNIK